MAKPRMMLRAQIDENLGRILDELVGLVKSRGVTYANKSAVVRSAIRLTHILVTRNQELLNYFVKMVNEDVNENFSRLPQIRYAVRQV